MDTLVAFIGIASVLVMMVGAVAVAKGNILTLGIKSRKAGLVVIIAGFVLFMAMMSIDVNEAPAETKADGKPQGTVQEQPQPEPELQKPDPAASLEQDYVDFVSESSEEIGKALQEVGRLCQSMSFTDDWVLETAVNVGIIQHYCNQVLEKQPPEKFKEAHDIYVKACSFYILAMDSLTTGIDNFDAAEIDKAAAYLDRGTEHIDVATAEFLKLITK